MRSRFAVLLVVVAVLAGCSSGTGSAPPVAQASPSASPASPAPTPSPVVYGAPQYRALWVDAFHDGMKSPAQVEKLVADAHRANLNALIVQVRKRGDAYFNISDEPRATDIKGPADFDPLGYLIRLAHGAIPRIEVHAWLNTFFVGDTSQIYVQQGGAWRTRANDGSRIGWLDPGVPAVRDYTTQLFLDVARNYDVDGLHMDFVRYPGQTWGYNPTAVALYKQQTGAKATPAASDPAWEAWRRAQVTTFVRGLHDQLKQVKPNVKLSGALICFGGGPSGSAAWPYTSAYSSVFQDWMTWLKKGDLDFGVTMNYDSDWNPQQQSWFNAWLAFEKDSGFAGRVVTGVGGFLNYPENTLAQIRRVLAPSPRGNRVLGVAIYSYGSTSVYGSDDFYTSRDNAAGLPHQPYFDNIRDSKALVLRARVFNDWFMTELSAPYYYPDVARGWVGTRPVFTQPAKPPVLRSA